MALLLVVVVTANPRDESVLMSDELTDVNNPEDLQQFFKLKKIKKLLLG
jgi:hypothetical protein